ncbi:fibrobacter succinogenes major paralogous domain-containing protein [Fibrobacter sp.]|uniref:fibrobacter succinogenes major paralogous domain-containing protein n=1 Tax=Fibrobacter sp. TaxID=35828 RepID=UPI00386F5D18
MLLKNLWWGKKSLRGGVAAATVSGLLLLAACGGDSGTSAPSDNGASDSEKIQSSSSSQKHSSSSQKSSSSSNLKTVSSSSNQSSSSSEENDDGWSWDVPKEARLNPEIDYGSMTDPRDGQIYKTVKIGDQIWMAENLNYADSVKTPSLMGKNWCYANKAENCAVTGRLYTWTAAIDSVKLATDADNPQDCGSGKECTLPDTVQGICPPGWHLPEKKEWDTLLTKVGGEATALNVLKSQTGWFRQGNGSDDVGFSALPAGDRIDNGNFFDIGKLAGFWSASETDYNYAKALDLGYCSNYAVLGYYNKSFGFSVRCLKD